MEYIELKNKKFLVPEMFSDKISNSSSFSVFKNHEVENTGKIIKELKSGRFILLENTDQRTVDNLYNIILRRINELISFDDNNRIRSKSFSRNRRSEFSNVKNEILNRLLIIAENNNVISFKSGDTSIRNLISFCGQEIYSYKSEVYIVPYKFLIELEESLKLTAQVNSINTGISAGINVLLPKSQETTELFKAAMLSQDDRSSKKILDMGCGSGVLTVLSDSIYSNSEIHFTDILPESIASTIYNIENITGTGFDFDDEFISCKTDSNKIICRRTGDLFEHVEDKFDAIFFNPPWINAEARNRSEKALNDKDQIVLKRFLIQAKNALKPGGSIILSYSDNSGEKAVANLDALISENNFNICFEKAERVQSYQSGRKWMKILVRILKRKVNE